MIRLLPLLLVLILAPKSEAQPPSIEVGGREFAKNLAMPHDDHVHGFRALGSHKRKKFFFSVYAAVGYLDNEDYWTRVRDMPEDTDFGSMALSSGGEMVMHLKMLRGLDATRITNGINEALEKTAVRPIENIADERERFVGLFDGELQEDQNLVFVWWRGTGLEIRRDEEVLDTIPGDAFARAFFEIYYGPNPIDDGMKKDLLRQVRVLRDED